MEEWTAAQNRAARGEPLQGTQERRQENAAGEQQAAASEHELIRGQEEPLEEPRELATASDGLGRKSHKLAH